MKRSKDPLVFAISSRFDLGVSRLRPSVTQPRPCAARLSPSPWRAGRGVLFLVRRRRLGRTPRRFVQSLKLDHPLNQLVLAQARQNSPIHARMDSEIALHGKGVGKYVKRESDRNFRRLVVVVFLLHGALSVG